LSVKYIHFISLHGFPLTVRLFSFYYASVNNTSNRDFVNYFIYVYYNAMQEQQFVS
jgi:hypothetical protein